MGTLPVSRPRVVYFAKELICKCKYLGALIIYSILKIILKEREERKQQRLQENAVSPALAGDDVQDVESGDDLALEQEEPAGTSSVGCAFSWGSHVQQTPRDSASLRH